MGKDSIAIFICADFMAFNCLGELIAWLNGKRMRKIVAKWYLHSLRVNESFENI